MSSPPVSLKNPRVAALLAWLFPGAGHIYQGRVGKGVLYMVCILSLFYVGLAMGEGKNVYWKFVNPLSDPENFRFSYVCQFFVGLPALPGLIQGWLKYKGFGPILGGYLAEPSTNGLNAIFPKLGSKLVEVGSVYTVVAGLLNILAIYDAAEGPAYGDEIEPAAPIDAAALDKKPVAAQTSPPASPVSVADPVKEEVVA
jgi:hypothetical protein